MSHPWPTIGLAFLGAIAGAVIGVVVGRAYRGRPANALLAVIVAFVGACWALVYAARTGDSWVASVGLGVAFGAMTAVKYSSGLLLGAGGASRAEAATESVDADVADAENREDAA